MTYGSILILFAQWNLNVKLQRHLIQPDFAVWMESGQSVFPEEGPLPSSHIDLLHYWMIIGLALVNGNCCKEWVGG
jgi:hypothetical protein